MIHVAKERARSQNRRCDKSPDSTHYLWSTHDLWERGLPAKNDDTVCLTDRGALIAGKPRLPQEQVAPQGLISVPP
ncbi:hypothetical protein C4E44_16300 [Pseudomonas sp. MWU12-2312b]|nr:hypothetical protein C4E44_16300 [Pseudomonas sp. MWU12-2312b]